MKYRIIWISAFLIGCISFGLLAIHWEKPNLTGANGQIIHRIITSCNQ